MYRESVDVYRHVLNLRERRRQTPAGHSRDSGMPQPERASASPTPGDAVDTRLPKDLTPREREVAQLLVLGYSNAQIAERLVITSGTTANHVAHILSKLGVANRAQVVARVLQPNADAMDGITLPGRDAR